MSRLLAISDLHVDRAHNLDALRALPAHSRDDLLVPGDVADSLDLFEEAWRVLGPKFRSLTWTPGNHELWCRHAGEPVGEARYEALVQICRRHGVLTPEDPPWTGHGVTVVPLFLLYDLSFRPPEVPLARVRAWAREAFIVAADDRWLITEPYPDIAAWSDVLVERAQARLAALPGPLVVLSHYPLRQELVRLYQVPRYAPWCGTERTRDWHRRFPIQVALHGHLHMRATDWVDGVRFEEVALGYPQHWQQDKGVAGYLREILPGPPPPAGGMGGPHWHR